VTLEPISRIEAFVFRYPVKTPVRTSFGIMHDRPAVFVRVEDRDGAAGWGEVWCNFPSVGAEHRARLVEEVLAPILVGHAFEGPRAAFEEMSARTAVLAIQSGEHGPLAQAIAGIDIALWDLAGRRSGEPLWRLLGGTTPTIRVYASGINPTSPEIVVRDKLAQGYRAFKLKIGFGRDLDRRNLSAMREVLGDGAHLAVDANQAWTLDEARAAAKDLEPYRPAWVEEPLRADRPWTEWRKLKRHLTSPLAAGENFGSAEAFHIAIAEGALGVVQPDLAKWGGFSGCTPIARKIIAAGLSFCPHYLGGGVGLAASAHFLAAVGGDGLLECDANENPLRDDIPGALETISEGRLRLSNRPGLGMDVNLEALGRYRVPHKLA
jgi:L-alanine-DL-glutamate epimerase-like enolase superfamily enzyme